MSGTGYRLAGRDIKTEHTVVKLKNCSIGGGNLFIIAGPCAVEGEEMIYELARLLKDMGVNMLRGGVFKPRTSPYSFQGLQWEGLKILSGAAGSVGLPVVTEVTKIQDVEKVCRYADMLQIGSRNMQNFGLLTEVGRSGFPVLLKRGLSSTIEEWLMAAEYILLEGNGQVVLCERGIRTFELYTRNTFDINAIPALKSLTHLPVIADPSHGTGRSELVAPVSLAAVAAGADGLMVEVHPNPGQALSDGVQSLTPEAMKSLVQKARNLHSMVKIAPHAINAAPAEDE
ncbi:3-deoxy-D-arabinoheptulosonate-7-phosphate synthase [Desulfotomaculum arcticum]|uniref:3-deoxy-D-arabinoheptulosonate-7-phosphate synthase n=1 Tax=Desulfotruncus arcticus DSM 17038 TaxID=1121424 RepID=A0A1I2MT99_9FIRM|nr:3-deoxy-7-phosphoheptulonate synthase [Desulfotruncus arcticus]SFF94702.1 3-deoxy-D-arabinoheptulosonate-7-phosphate synthase [Desulfotomaculum arcticum] [Desulfotruncus arcticus DSM 17038]